MVERAPFSQRLADGALVFDGAMGTALYERGLLYTSCLDAACLNRPDLVSAVHESYHRAGADVIQTNTFGANEIRLETHGLASKLEAINTKAVELARGAATGAYVVAAVGPSGLIMKALGQATRDRIRAAIREQCAILAEAGVDGISLETFRQPEELALAIEAAVAGTRGAVPVIASVSFDPFGTTADGSGPEETARRLAGLGVAAIGVNCGDGPAGVYEMATRMLEGGVPVVAQPNAGLPHRVDGRLAYRATPQYFQLYARRLFKAGVAGVGGCCGTTSEHIAEISSAARMAGSSASIEPGGGMRDDRASVPGAAPGCRVTPTGEKGLIGQKIAKGEFLVSVEVNPPAGLSLDKAIAGAKLLRDGGVHVINVADGPRASARMGNLALCVRIQRELGMPALMHVTTRDRNLLGSVAHLLASHELGVSNLVVITGDPPKMGDFPGATAVYDTDSIGLLRLVQGLNRGYDPGGKAYGAATRFLCATGAEPAAQDYDRELRRLEQKIEAGAELVMTQPVYDPRILERFLADTRSFGAPVLVGLLPLASFRNAEFLHNEVPGMAIPADVRARMKEAGSGESGRAAGVKIAREMLEAVREDVGGAYIMPPFGRYELALRVIDGLV